MTISASETFAYTVTTFSPTGYPYTDSQLGIDGMTIEDFEDGNLASGLSVLFGYYTSEGTHPFSTDDITVNSSLAWDGNNILVHDTSYYSVFFTFDTPVTSFGIGFSNASEGVDIEVNNMANMALVYSLYVYTDNRRN